MLPEASGIKSRIATPFVPYVVVGVNQKGCFAWLASPIEILMREGWRADRNINPLA
jgi:hypothetical protein